MGEGDPRDATTEATQLTRYREAVPLNAIARALTGPAEELSHEDLTEAITLGLAGALSARLNETHPSRALLQPARLTLLARHMRVRATLKPLLHAWNASGIVPLLLKGFAHACFTYRDPSMRAYGDVDLLLPETQAAQAVQIARRLGWHDDGLSDAPRAWTHETAHLFSPEGQVRIDVHRHIVGLAQGRHAKAIQVTRAFVHQAQEATLDGATVRLLSPHDSALMVAITRCWSLDAGQPKPADYLDLEALCTRTVLSAHDVAHRADELGAHHTWQAFQQRVNPWSSTLVLDGTHVPVNNAAALTHDGINLKRAFYQYRARTFPSWARDVLWALPDVVWVWRALRAGADVRAAPRALRLTPGRGTPYERALSATRGVSWAIRALYPKQSERGVCLPRSLALYRALLRRGIPATFVSGVRRGANGIEGHAWVELPDGLRDFEELHVRERYRATFKVTPLDPTPEPAPRG